MMENMPPQTCYQLIRFKSNGRLYDTIYFHDEKEARKTKREWDEDGKRRSWLQRIVTTTVIKAL